MGASHQSKKVKKQHQLSKDKDKDKHADQFRNPHGFSWVTHAARGAVWRLLFFTLMAHQFNKHTPHQTFKELEVRMFSYDQFEWLHATMPTSASGVDMNRKTGLALALMAASGLAFTFSSSVFTLMYARQFLLFNTAFTNHDYLFILLGALTSLSSVGKYYSLDSILAGRLYLTAEEKSRTRPDDMWVIVLIRAQIAVVYFFSSLWKLHPDWLKGYTCKEICLSFEDRNDGGSIVWSSLFGNVHWIFQGVALAGLFLDFGMFVSWTMVMPCRQWVKYILTVHLLFHGFTFVAMGQRIGYAFPVCMLCADLLLLPVADVKEYNLFQWICRVCRRAPGTGIRPPWRAIFIVWIVLQIAIPMRMPLFSNEYYAATAETYRWSWTMMLHSKDSIITMKDAKTGPYQFMLFNLNPEVQVCQTVKGHCEWRVLTRQEYGGSVDEPTDMIHTLPLNWLGSRGVAMAMSYPRLLPRVANAFVFALTQTKVQGISDYERFRVKGSVFIRLNGIGPYARMVDSSKDLAKVFRETQKHYAESWWNMLEGVVTDKPPPGLEYFLRGGSLFGNNRSPEQQAFYLRIQQQLAASFKRSKSFLLADRYPCLAESKIVLPVGGRTVAVVVLQAPASIELRSCLRLQNGFTANGASSAPCESLDFFPSGLTKDGNLPENIKGSGLAAQPWSLEIGVTAAGRDSPAASASCGAAEEDVLIGVVL